MARDETVLVAPERLGEQLYRGVLGRAPDPTGLAHLVQRLQSQGLDATGPAIDDMLRSPEFQARWQSQFRPGGTAGPDLLVLDLADRDAQRSLGFGWHASEASGTWATGQVSVLQFEAVPWPEGATLFLELLTAGDAETKPDQRIAVSVNGTPVGRYVVSHRQPCTLVCHVSGEVLGGKAGLVITIDHPDAVVLSDLPGGSQDIRDLSIMLREARLERLTPARSALVDQLRAGMMAPPASVPGAPALPDADLARVAARFESLGSNCEFGFVQRRLGYEPLSLLRFAGLPLHKLMRGLRCGFRDLALPAHFHMKANSVQEDWLGQDDLYLLSYHTGQPQASTDPARLAEVEAGRLRFLARKLLDDIEDGDKVLVVKDDQGLAPEQIASLVEILRQHGPSTLLWVDLASAEHPAGSVDLLCPGVIRGYIDHYADLNIGEHTIDHIGWMKILLGSSSLK